MRNRMSIKLLALVITFGMCSTDMTFDFPEDWYVNGGFLYKFEGEKTESYDDAVAMCNMHGARVLNVDNLAENSFIVQWLQANDPLQREWYTSGVADTSADKMEEESGFLWESTGEPVEGALMSLWLQLPKLDILRCVIVYSMEDSIPGWLFVDSSVKRPYICKIPQEEVYRILEEHRGFDYGSIEGSRNQLERGPHFVIQPQNVVVVEETDRDSEPVSLECLVFANPPASYKWFKGKSLDKEIIEGLDNRYTITSGKLTIDQPHEVEDSDVYQCAAHNKFGTVLSDVVEITFGTLGTIKVHCSGHHHPPFIFVISLLPPGLGEFNNVQDAGTRVKTYEGATLECSNIQFKPGIIYQWIKGNSQQFVRTEFQEYMFISNNGKLYFSEVTRNDEDEYKCVATLTGVNSHMIGTSQPPMRTSLPIPFIVDDQVPKADWGPEIQNDFIAVFPKTPLAGHDVRLECFAYGSFESSTSTFLYSWSRDDKAMPESAEMHDHNRVLILRDAVLEDSGIYRCTVSRGSQASDTKTVHLNMEAKPYFVNPLEDQHADIHSQITWICNARGRPDPVYHWYKNGEKLTPRSGNRQIKVQRNVLTISHLDPDKHSGMYQCGAENSHGVSLSNAQLRVLAFAPTVSKYPPPTSLLAPEKGNITLRCQPEGAPFPVIQWFKDGSLISSDRSKFTVLANGNLHITLLSISDSGTYTCMATNIYGEVNASTILEITHRATITLPPSETTTVVNKTVFFACEASHPKDIDLVYEWTFNGFPLDFDKDTYRQTQNDQPGSNGLYIVNANFDHEGQYTCTARTPFNAESKSAYLKIMGPPRQPAGVYALSDTVTQNSTVIVWTEGSSSHGIISAHIIQAADEFEPQVWKDVMIVSVEDSYRKEDPTEGKHSIIVSGLNPGIGYQLRILAQNEYGPGAPSDPSPYIQMLASAPCIYPRNLRGGGGSVGDLTIRWDPLHRSEYGARSVSYNIYWRKKETVISRVYEAVTVADTYKDCVVIQVGAENYYLAYEVKIQAFNELGHGPNSSVVDIYSAEELPLAVPQNVKTSTYNGTAIEVFWDEVPDTREYMRGKIVGYQINYWDEELDPDIYMQSIRYYGQRNYGLVIGLVENFNWIVDIQVYNSAGLGPRSNQYIMETSGYAPLTYPQEVHISSAGPHRARLWWRGVSLTVNEEALVGYAIWLWTASESFRSAELIEVPGRVCSYVLKNIKDKRLYAMRIAAVGGGGYGKKSPPTYFTIEGQVLIDHRLAEMIDTFLSDGIEVYSSAVLVLICYSAWFLIV